MSCDNPEELAGPEGKIARLYDCVFDVVSNCPADIVFSGANFDSTITNPPFFKKHLLSSLSRQAVILHGKGRYLMFHTDCENQGFIALYLEKIFDSIGTGGRIIFSIADTTPPDARFSRIEYVARKVKEFGPVII
jgi:hypothetical protein